MVNKSLIGVSICAVILLILGSSSNVIGYQTEKGIIRNNIIDQSWDVHFKKVVVFEKVNLLKHPILFFIISVLAKFRLIRGEFLFNISTSIGAFNWINIEYPLLFFRAYWLTLSTDIWLTLWKEVSDSRGWNWPLDYIE
jgi:hypothetical protein